MSMLHLFRVDAESQVQRLTTGLLALERDPSAAPELEACMRAAHSLKGAARIVGLDAGVDVAHAMEDCFVAAQRGEVAMLQARIDVLLRGVDLLARISHTPEERIGEWARAKRAEVEAFVAALNAVACEPPARDRADEAAPAVGAARGDEGEASLAAAATSDGGDRALRVTAEILDRLVGLAGESLVESRWLEPFSKSMLRLARRHHDAARAFGELREALPDESLNEHAERALLAAERVIRECHRLASEHRVNLEQFASRSARLANQVYETALTCRMRPFSDGVRGFPRMVRDLGRSLGKRVRLEIVGDATRVDRDILERLDAPLGHLLRNAVDHGVDPPEERAASGKPAEGVIRLEASHSAGKLQIAVSDDGRGIDLEALRAAIVARKLVAEQIAQKLCEAELFEFLFLPGFTMKETVSEISGRGVGLDVVQNMLKEVRGTVRVSSQTGRGTRFHLQLPLTLSVIRTLLVDIAGEPYAIPLPRIMRTLKPARDEIAEVEGRPHIAVDGRRVGLVSARQVLTGDRAQRPVEGLAAVILADSHGTYGLVVDGLLGECELVVQPLAASLGKIEGIAAGGLLENGSPVLIVDVDDLLRAVEKLVSAGTLSRLPRGAEADAMQQRKRILVVDDSLTVRELERKMLRQAGYDVHVAVDGMDGWNAVRAGRFDLVVTDVDMPRIDGIELVELIKGDRHLGALPVIIVSYKDREEDRSRGLEAGADRYLTKGSFEDETLIRAVADLIGGAQP
jgi:two-component system sensor histidine kinase and response regulator WspE